MGDLSNAVPPNLIFSCVDTVTINNNASEISTLPATGKGRMPDRTLPANWWTPGKALEISIGGIYKTPTTPNSVMNRVKLGSDVFTAKSVAGTVLSSSSTTNRFFGKCNIVCRTTGVNGTFSIDGDLNFGIILSAIPLYASIDIDNDGIIITSDTTVAKQIDLTTQWGSAQNGQGTVTNQVLIKEYQT